MNFQDVLRNTLLQLTRYRNGLNGVTIMNHRDLIFPTLTVCLQTMLGNLHVRVYPQPVDLHTDFCSLSSLHLMCSVPSFGNFFSFFLYVFCTDRKRVPLPPQAATFLTSSIAPAYTRDPPSHSAATPVAPRSHRLPDISGPDGISTLAPPPHLPGDSYSEIRDFGRSRQEPSGMKEERMDRYSRVVILLYIQISYLFTNLTQPRSKSRGRASEYMRLPVQPSSGTNNIPIGNRKLPTPSMPPLAAHAASSFPLATGYNPDARPPPSTLIDPVKARELLPPGKESYERVRVFLQIRQRR